MASLVYNSLCKDAFLGRVVIGTSVIKAMLVTSAYIENKDTHLTRADITNEVSGTGYTAGGQTITATLTQDLTTEKTIITLPSVTFANSTLSGVRKVIYYVANGGASSGDYLIGVNDLGADYSSSGNSLIIAATTLTLNNP
jgi:hypothetical protein